MGNSSNIRSNLAREGTVQWKSMPGLVDLHIENRSPRVSLLICLLSILIVFPAGISGQDVPPAPPETKSVDASVGALLDAIDKQSTELKDFSAGIRLDSLDGLSGGNERRVGRVYFTIDGGDKPRRKAAMILERTVDPEGRARERLEHYVYADGVLSDYDHEARKLTRRQLVGSDENRDPLRLGEGPIPIPIGQRKADILRSFKVELGVEPPSGLVKDPAEVHGLHLVPRPGTLLAEKDKIQSIDLWVDRKTSVAVAVSMLEADGDRVSARFFKSKVNEGIEGEDAKWLNAPEVDPREWRIDSR